MWFSRQVAFYYANRFLTDPGISAINLKRWWFVHPPAGLYGRLENKRMFLFWFLMSKGIVRGICKTDFDIWSVEITDNNKYQRFSQFTDHVLRKWNKWCDLASLPEGICWLF